MFHNVNAFCLFISTDDEARHDRNGQDGQDDGEGNTGRYFDDVVQGHLDTNPDQHEGKSDLEVNKSVHQVSKQEVHRTKTQDSERVCGEDQEGF